MGADKRGASPLTLVTDANDSTGFEACLVNVAGPGFVATSGVRGGHPVCERVASVVWATTLPDDGSTGNFFRDGEVPSW